jgi:hypothetical protein
MQSDEEEGNDHTHRSQGHGTAGSTRDCRSVTSRMSSLKISPQQRAMMENQFEKTILEYGDSDIGDLEEDEDEEVSRNFHHAPCAYSNTLA